MNKDLINQLPVDERAVAEKLSSAAETMKLSQDFQWNLETHLMNLYPSKTHGIQRIWFTKFLSPIVWAVTAIIGVLAISWMLRSLLPGLQPAAVPTQTQNLSFEAKVRTGNICNGPLALAHGFSIFLTNPAKSNFVPLDPEKTIGELRSFAWSPDGEQLAIVGNTTGRGNIYLTDSAGGSLQPVLSNSDLGYLFDAAWSRNGEKFLMWSAQNNNTLFLMNQDGSGLIEKQLDLQILSTPQFTPGNQSVVFYGANASSSGLFELRLQDLQAKLISPFVEDETGFAFSPDGSHLAYMEMDRNLGEARLVIQEFTSGSKSSLGTLPIPKGSGSSIPESDNLNWSSDGKSLVLDFGRGANNRTIYLAAVNGTELAKVVEPGYAPAISADGKCLAYINDKKVFLLDITGPSPTSPSLTPVLLADLPAGRGAADYRLDKLQWKP